MNYSNYYANIPITTKGLKPVYGATGLGKTFGAKEYIKKVLLETPCQKFIYITNRHALIKETYNSLNDDYDIKTVYLKGNIDTFKDLHGDGKLLAKLLSLVDKGFFMYDIKGMRDRDDAKQFFEEKIKTLRDFGSLNNRGVLEKEIDKIYSSVNRVLKEQFYLFKKQRRKQAQEQFLKDEDVWALYPYVQFENDDNTNVCVGTIQKFCHGFFNGVRDMKLHDVEHPDKDANIVIFLDEFDFLENEILSILSKEPQLNNPMEFVRFFYEDFESWKENDFWNKDKDLKYVKDRMENTHQYLKDTIKDRGIDFPSLRRFIFDNDDFKKGKNHKFILFQNNNITLSEFFYLAQKQERTDAFQITKQASKDTISPHAFFGMIKSATEQLTRTFESIKDRVYLMEEIIDYIWNSKNNNERGGYHKYIMDNFAYKFKRRSSESRIDASEEDFGYLSGFSLTTLKKENSFDTELADLEQLELITSPESVIQQLTDKNLVFALSATADIPRMVNSFNHKWLSENTNFIEPSNADIELLENLKKVKNLARLNLINLEKRKELDAVEDLETLKEKLDAFEVGEKRQVHFSPNKELSVEHNFYPILKQLKGTGYYQNENDTNEGSQDGRYGRTLRFFGCLDWIIKQSKNRTHLVFLTSFRNELALFDESTDKVIPNLIRKKINKDIKIEKRKYGYKVGFDGAKFNMLFLNAGIIKSIEEEAIADYDALFTDTEAEKVIVVTQYATASNGLNLRCLNENGEERDFEGIHLLEKRHFWFDTDKDNYLNNKKKSIWYLWKLWQDGQIGKSMFKKYLEKSNLKKFNNFYESRYEYTFSQIALFHQALGRIDRKRLPVPQIDVTLDIDVLKLFKNFLTEPQYTEHQLIQNRDRFTSDLILDLHKAISKYLSSEEARMEFAEEQHIGDRDSRSRKVIDNLLTEIKKINNGEYDNNTDEARSIIDAWQNIRENVLSRDYFGETLYTKPNDLIFKTNLLQKDELLYFSTTEYKLYSEYFISDEIIKWNLNRPYLPIQKNEWLKSKFIEFGYAIGYRPTDRKVQRIYTPYIEQAILRGAIGEAAIEFLLAKHGLYCDKSINIPIKLFELYDAKLKNVATPIYIDFKNFSEHTLDSFALTENDWEYKVEFDSKNFLEKVQSKLLKIREVTGEIEAKYIIINFVGNENRKSKYFDIHLNEIEYFVDSDIVIVPSTIYREDNSKTSKEFILLINNLKNLQKQAYDTTQNDYVNL